MYTPGGCPPRPTALSRRVWAHAPATRLTAAFSTLLWFGVAAGVVAQDRDPDAKIAGGGTLPAGWHARTDKNRPLADAKIQTMGTGLHTTLGPAVILWREPDPRARHDRLRTAH